MSVRWIFNVAASDHGPEQRIPIQAGTTIGRSSKNELTLPEPSVSSFHARVDGVGAELGIVDIGSQNGTVIEGLGRLPKDRPVALKAGMRIRFARTEVVVVAESLGVDPSESTIYGGPPSPGPSSAPAPPPAPAPAPAPAPPAQFPPPVPSGHGPLDDEPSGQFATLQANRMGPEGELAAVAALETMGARLILMDQAQPRVVPIVAATNTIGRRSAADVHIQSGSVSYRHAEIRFVASTFTFQIKDLESANGTVLNRVTLTPDISQRIELDSCLRIGPIEAVLRANVESDRSPTPPDFDERVAARLISKAKLNPAAFKSAKKDAPGPLGDALILAGHVAPDDWADAARETRLFGSSAGGGAAKKIALVLLFIAVAAAIAFVAFKEQLMGS